MLKHGILNGLVNSNLNADNNFIPKLITNNTDKVITTLIRRYKI